MLDLKFTPTKFPLRLLLVEDNPDDVKFLHDAFFQVCPAGRIDVVEDGDKALEYLHRAIEGPAELRPDLVLLDLNLPRLDGHEVLERAKTDPLLKTVPVIVMSTARIASEVSKAYDRHANAVLTKPADFSGYPAIMASLVAFWSQTAALRRQPD